MLNLPHRIIYVSPPFSLPSCCMAQANVKHATHPTMKEDGQAFLWKKKKENIVHAH